MKNVEELGISKGNWKIVKSLYTLDIHSDEGIVCETIHNDDDANMIRAAPKLYKALYDILDIVCDGCVSPCEKNGKCAGCPRVKAARAALKEAAREES